MTRERVVEDTGTLPPEPAASPMLRLLLWMLKGLRIGTLDVRLPGGATRAYAGAEPGPHGVLHILDERMAGQVVRGGAIGFAEAWMDGRWESPDPVALLHVLCLNERHYFGPYEKNVVVQACHRLMHRLRANTRRQARRNIEYHYDLGNDFYRLWLDPTLTYSSAVFGSPGETLEQAQLNKYRHMLQRLQLEPGHHLLEIGSGWGGFAIHAARETGCRVTGLTLSQEQLVESRHRAAQAQVSDRVQFVLRDYRDDQGPYDRVASIEMYEAVGEAYWPDYFGAIARALRPGGRAAIQGITIDPKIFHGYRRRVDFIQKYIFPGGMLASPEVFERQARAAGLRPEAPRFFGLDYAETLRRWHQNVLATGDRIARRYGERFLRMWRYYLAYCECGFRAGNTDVMQVTLTKS